MARRDPGDLARSTEAFARFEEYVLRLDPVRRQSLLQLANDTLAHPPFHGLEELPARKATSIAHAVTASASRRAQSVGRALESQERAASLANLAQALRLMTTSPIELPHWTVLPGFLRVVPASGKGQGRSISVEQLETLRYLIEAGTNGLTSVGLIQLVYLTYEAANQRLNRLSKLLRPDIHKISHGRHQAFTVALRGKEKKTAH